MEEKNIQNVELNNQENTENKSKSKFKASSIVTAIIIVAILIGFGFTVYYNLVIKPAADVDKKAGFTAEEYIKLGKCSGFKHVITQKDFDNSVHEETDAYATVERKSKKGDHVEFSAKAYIDNKKVDDLSQDTIEIGIGDDLEGVYKDFEKVVTGVKVGQNVKTTVDASKVKSLSKDKKSYSGKVVYKLKIVNVSELEREKITDKWVKESYNEEYGLETVADFYNWIDEYLTEEATKEFWQKTIDSATMNGWPSKLYDSVVKEFTLDANYQADAMGMTYDEYLAFQQLSNKEDLEEEYKNEVKSSLVMWAMVKKYKLKASDSEIEDKYEELIDGEDYKTIEEVKKDYKRSEIEESVLLDKAQEYVTKHSKIVKKFKY